jgi:hypothetical protein
MTKGALPPKNRIDPHDKISGDIPAGSEISPRFSEKV